LGQGAREGGPPTSIKIGIEAVAAQARTIAEPVGAGALLVLALHDTAS
jgi:hypothetical protein